MKLLLDFDGVVLRRHKALNLIAKRCNLYVKRHFSKINYDEAKKLNTYLYKNYGHTLIGLEEEYSKKIDLEDFNKHVYSDINYDELFDNIQETHKYDIQDINFLYADSKFHNYSITIFSNAPSAWSYTILKKMGIKESDICILNLYERNLLKPRIEAYKYAEKTLTISDEEPFILLDDSSINCKPVIDRKNWSSILFDENGINNCSCITRIFSLSELCFYI